MASFLSFGIFKPRTGSSIFVSFLDRRPTINNLMCQKMVLNVVQPLLDEQ